MTSLSNKYSWEDVLVRLADEPFGSIIRIAKNQIDHPLDAGARQSTGLPMGQHADFRWALSDCSGLHVRDFGTHYEVHIDQVDPSCDLVEHLRQDAPGAYVGGSAALGVLFGSLFGGTKDSAFVGGAIGALFGALTLPKDQDP